MAMKRRCLLGGSGLNVQPLTTDYETHPFSCDGIPLFAMPR
jgi:hypothetical protein